MSAEEKFFSGYQIEMEPRALIKARARESTQLWRAAAEVYQWDEPAELDPRSWFGIPDQKQTNSCVGQSGAEGCEFSQVIAGGDKVELSRSWSYLAAQEASGYLGRDVGADLNGFTRAAERGIPLESDFPWSDSYSQMLSSYRARKAEILASPLYKVNSEVVINSAAEAKKFIAGWTGAVHIGISWPGFTLVDGWEIHSYDPRRSQGGHAILITGYLKVQSWPEGYGLLLKNSWNVNWGRQGWALVKPSAFDSMMRASSNIGIGRSDMVSPAPRPGVAA